MIMKTSCELQKKLNKLPSCIKIEEVYFHLNIRRYDEKDQIVWGIVYLDNCDNALLRVRHNSLQAVVDNTLAELKKVEYYATPQGKVKKTIFG